MNNLTMIFFSILILAGAFVAGLVIHYIIFRLIGRYHARKPISFGGMTVQLNMLVTPLRALIPAVCASVALPFLVFPSRVASMVSHALKLWIMGSIAWLVIRGLGIAREMIVSRLDLNAKDNLHARRLTTQLRVFERVLVSVVAVLAVASMLMTFNGVREVGLSILASAGVIGLIIGFAAQRSIGTLLTGMHLALTQPIRLGDAVLVENEFGYIEEITLTYVVVRLWDQRRMIVPVTHFLEKPFQNWTRNSSQLIGTVFIYSDYNLPVQRVRDALTEILERSPLWDKRIAKLQVTNSTGSAIELRALASADDAPKTWDLRCHVREQLIEFIQREFPASLPRTRVEFEPESAAVTSRLIAGAAG